MAITQAYSISAVSISTTEISIVSGTSTLANDTTAGAYQLIVDPIAAAMAKGDEFRIKVYEKTLSGGTKRLLTQYSLLGAQSELFVAPSLMLLWGWDMTLTKVAGTDRSFTASIRKAA